MKAVYVVVDDDNDIIGVVSADEVGSYQDFLDELNRRGVGNVDFLFDKHTVITLDSLETRLKKLKRVDEV